MKKKVLSLLLAIAMACSLAACGGDKDPEPERDIPSVIVPDVELSEDEQEPDAEPENAPEPEPEPEPEPMPEPVVMNYTFEDGTLTCSGNGEIVRKDWIEVVKNVIFDPDEFGCASAVETLVIEPGVTAIGESAFANCSNLAGELVIPDSVVNIRNTAFTASGSLTGVVIPDSITEIGESAFANCQSLSNVSLSKNLKEIPRGLFESCQSLTTIEIPESVTAIRKNAFSFSGLTEVAIPDSVTFLGEAFGGTPMKEFTVPASVTEWERPLPFMAGLDEITILCEATMDNVESLFKTSSNIYSNIFETYRDRARNSGFTIHAPAGSVVEGYVKRQIETNQYAADFTFEAI